MEIRHYDGMPPEAMAIRKSVFVKEQGFHDEFDEIDAIAEHLVAFDQDKPIATCRFFPKEGTRDYIIGRVAVDLKYRGKSIGTELLRTVEKIVYEKKGSRTILHAQLKAKRFYEKQGYFPYGEVELEENSPHIWMYKSLTGGE